MTLISKMLSSRYLPSSASLVWVAAVLASGCSVTVSQLSQPDPSDPRASIGGESPYSTGLSADSNEESEAGSESPSPASSHSQHDHEMAEMVYACPMHADVTGEEGSSCPRCGMTLVLREDPVP